LLQLTNIEILCVMLLDTQDVTYFVMSSVIFSS